MMMRRDEEVGKEHVVCVFVSANVPRFTWLSRPSTPTTPVSAPCAFHHAHGGCLALLKTCSPAVHTGSAKSVGLGRKQEQEQEQEPEHEHEHEREHDAAREQSGEEVPSPGSPSPRGALT